MFRQRIKHYHQWLHSTIHLKTKIGQSSPDSFRLQGRSQRTSSDLLHPVSSVKERNRKSGKCKISRVLQLPVSSPQASPKVEASDRPKQAQCLPTCRKVQNGNIRVHQGLSDSRGMGVIDRFIRRLPSYPHPPKLKEVPMVLPQVTGVPVHLPSVRTGHSPTGLYNPCKGSEVDGPHKGYQASPVPEELADQGPVSGRSPSEHSDSGRPDSVLRVDNKSGFDPTSQVKTCFDCKMFDVTNWVARLNGENGPGGMPSHEALSVSPQGPLEIFSVAGQPPSLDRNHFSTPRLVAKSHKRDEKAQTFIPKTTVSNSLQTPQAKAGVLT